MSLAFVCVIFSGKDNLRDEIINDGCLDVRKLLIHFGELSLKLSCLGQLL